MRCLLNEQMKSKRQPYVYFGDWIQSMENFFPIKWPVSKSHYQALIELALFTIFLPRSMSLASFVSPLISLPSFLSSLPLLTSLLPLRALGSARAPLRIPSGSEGWCKSRWNCDGVRARGLLPCASSFPTYISNDAISIIQSKNS